MWKYVSRRIKDTIERSNAFDVKKTFTCANHGEKIIHSGTTVQAVEPRNPAGFCLVNFFKQQKSLSNCSSHNGYGKAGSKSSSSSSSHDEDEKKEKIRFNNGCFNNSLIGALTYSSAILCGWYTSQFMCSNRRRAGWEARCNYSRFLLNTTRNIHTNIISHRALAAPPIQVAHSKFNYIREFEEDLYDAKKIIQVNNEEAKEATEPTVESAVSDLLSVLGDIEYELGVNSIKAGQYKTAVSHLKLATSHHHPNATFNLGLCYEKGIGVEKNLYLAQECYQIASSLGHSKAMYNLGVFYVHGLGGLEE